MRTKVGNNISGETQRPRWACGPELQEVNPHRMGKHSGCEDPGWLTDHYGVSRGVFDTSETDGRLLFPLPGPVPSTFFSVALRDTTLSHTSKSRVKRHLVSHGCLRIPKLCVFLWFIFHTSKGFSRIISSSILRFTRCSPVPQCLALLLDQRPGWKKKKKWMNEYFLSF